MSRFISLVIAFAVSIVSCARAVAHAPAYNGKYHAPWFPFGQSTTPFAKPVGRLFSFDGKEQFLMGANVWWLSRLRNNSDVNTVLDELNGVGVKVIRAWGFATFNYTPPVDYGNMYTAWFQLLNQSGTYVNYGANGLERLDYLVYAAEERNMSLVLPMVDANSGLGGVDLYENVFGCTETEWYTSTACQNAYRSYVQTLVLRYKSSPAIFAWELHNEPRCEDCSLDVITNWAASTSKWVKSLDPNHMVAVGDEGWFGPSDGYNNGEYAYDGQAGVDWEAILKIPTIDYGTVHCYPQAYGYPLSWGSTWIKQHDTVAANVGKPAVIEEYGTQSGPFNHTGEAAWQMTVLKNTTIAMDQIFDFTTPYLSVGVPYSDSASVFYNDTANFNPLIKKHAAAMGSKAIP